MDEQEAAASLIRQAMAAPKGQLQLANAAKYLAALAEQFKTGTSVYPRVEDRRPPRRFLRYLLGA